MKNFILGLVLGACILAGVLWYYSDRNSHAQKATTQFQGAATEAKDFVQEKWNALDLTPDHIRQEMSKAGEVVRRKTTDAGNAIADATADARITGTIKAKL